MERVSRARVLMAMAEDVAKRGTCSRLQVGVVFARDGRVISTGYNGAPAGMPHCDHQYWDGSDPEPEWAYQLNGVYYLGKQSLQDYVINARRKLYWDGNVASDLGIGEEPPGCTVAEHAERNAIAFAARYGVALEGTEMYVTHMPCADCARSIINAGIARVVWKHPYRLTRGVEILEQAGVAVLDISQAV